VEVIAPLKPPTSLLLVDVENVRGKTNFQQTHEAFVARACAHHAKEEDILMVLVMDHGAQRTIQSGGPLSKNMAMVFAGPGQKADDVLMDLSRATQNQTVVVISSDNEVMKTCQQDGGATIIDPLAFLDTLKGLNNVGTLFPKKEEDDEFKPKALDAQQLLQKEVAARQELQMIDRLLNPRSKGKRSNKKMSRKQRSKLASRQLRAKERLTRVLEDSVVQGGTTMQSAIQSGNNTEFEAMVQGVEAASRAQIRRGAAETTYERQLLAERLRRRMEDAGALTRIDVDEEDSKNNEDLLPKVFAHVAAAAAAAASITTATRGQRFRNPDVRYNALDGASLGTNIITVQRNHRAPSTDEPRKPLRMLVMSDTHGFEEQIFKFVSRGTESAYQLPEADILIHCGDFWGGSRAKASRLDSFFAAQTHIPTKIVVRGNHDPRTPGSVLFPKSKSMYVTKTSTLELDGGIVVALRPHSRNYNEALLPPKCDILISHEPPFGVLDYTYHDQRAGSNALRYCVEASADKPSLWLCGHIHEGRGAMRYSFADKNPRPGQPPIDQTYVVNAATANEGKARKLVNGPVLIDLVDAAEDADQDEWVSSPVVEGGEPRKLMRHDSLEALVLADEQPEEQKENCLLAVDLGLRTGTAVFNSSGAVLAVDSWRFKDHDDLDQGLQQLLSSHDITHVVIEGEDRKLFSIWRRAIERLEGVQLARVVADDWRRMLLSRKEMRDARKAKNAAGMIAKQILKGNEELHGKKLSSDASEALLVGCYAVRVLGWDNSTEPAVQRYTNGDVAR
jgi:Icc-related predicted phosphoesterase